MTNREIHNILQHILEKAGCKILCCIGNIVEVEHLSTNMHGILLSADECGKHTMPCLDHRCYDPRQRERALLKWLVSESVNGRKIIAHLTDDKSVVVLETAMCIEKIAIETDMNDVI